VSLPWLEAMMPRTARAAGAAKPPLRMAFLYVPNGIATVRLRDGAVLKSAWAADGTLAWDAAFRRVLPCMPAWTPEKAGPLPEKLPEMLAPLAEFRDDFSIITGLANSPGNTDAGHGPALTSYLTCVTPAAIGTSSQSAGVSVDQVAAGRFGDRTRIPSLQMGEAAGSIGVDGVYMALSWRDAFTPIRDAGGPRIIFERLFAMDASRSGMRRAAERRSILDFIREDAGSLHGRLGADDRRKLDEYLGSIREIELRIERNAAMTVPSPPADLSIPPAHEPPTWAERIRLLGDLMVLAFQTDSTRLSTVCFSTEFSQMSFPYAGINDAHHDASHHAEDPVKSEACTRINIHMLEQFAHVLRRLKEVKEGEGSLLDNCIVTYGSGNSDGSKHSKSNLPLLLAGGGAGTLKPGRHVRFAAETPLANLWLSLLERYGANPGRFGNSTGLLEGL
jgi:hypothetical protein